MSNERPDSPGNAERAKAKSDGQASTDSTMNAKDAPDTNESTSSPSLFPVSFAGALTAGLLSWGVISIGFFGLKMLMQERPEFIGQPTRVTKAELVQESPQVVTRKVSDDIAVIKPTQPEFSDVRFDMNGRRDYRGLQTIMDMSGQFHARYVLTNAFEEPAFVLFKCPHPRSQDQGDQNLLAGELRLQSSANGVQENTKDAWFWSGTLDPRSSATIEVSYHVASLKGVTYRVSERSGNQVKQSRVTLNQKDVPSLRLESGDGARLTSDSSVVWERKDFLAPDFFSAQLGESRSLHSSLAHLLEIGPIICLLFLLAVSAVIVVRQKLTVVQMLTIAAGYAFYFPLILYLSANFSFKVALIIAFAVPGILLANYARWLVGSTLGLIGGLLFLAFYQVFPTLAAFAGWNRGMVLLCLGVVTLAVLINLQNRALKRKPAVVAAMLAMLLLPFHASATDVQVTLPAELVAKSPEPKREITNSLVAFSPAQYQVREESSYLRVDANIPFQVLRAGDTTVPLFNAPVHLQEAQFDAREKSPARLVTMTNHLAMFVQQVGGGTLSLTYRVPVVNHEGKKRAQIPLAVGLSGNVLLESARNDIEILTGNLWAKTAATKKTVYDIGVAGLDMLIIEWPEQGSGAVLVTTKQTEASKEFYGIGLTRAQNLTLINSDGSCMHFAEFDLPVSQTGEFRLKLPDKARLISVSANGAEINSPTVEDQICRIKIPGREAQQTAHRLSFRIAYPAMPFGFVGTAELVLPEVFQTAGSLEWIVALPNGFETQVVSSGLEAQKTPPDLSRFGDYGRLLKTQSHTHLAKSLAPPGAVNLSLKYRQFVPGMYEPRPESATNLAQR